MFSLFKKRKDHIDANFGENNPVNFFNQHIFKSGTTLEVKQNEFAIITCLGRVLDVFSSGVISLSLDRLPKLYSFLRSTNNIKTAQGIKKFPAEIYFVSGKMLNEKGLFTKIVKLFCGSDKFLSKIKFDLSYKIIAPEVFLAFLLKRRKTLPDATSLKLTKNLFVKEVSKSIKKQKLDFTENNFGLNKLSKIALAKLQLKKYGIQVESLNFLEFKASNKTLEKIKFLNNASKTLDVEFKQFTLAEAQDVVLEKVGTEAFIDKALPVDVIKDGERGDDVALLNINTGDDASKEIVFNRGDEHESVNMGEEYYNKLDNMLLKPQGETVKTNFEQVASNEKTNLNKIKSFEQTRDLFCRQCGARVDAMDKFCGICGHKLN